MERLDSDLSNVMVLSPELSPSMGVLPPTNSPQQLEIFPIEELRLPRRRKHTPTEPTEQMVSTDFTQMDAQVRAEATKKMPTSVLPNENPLNYVAALRLRKECGRRSSRDLFEDLN